MPELIERADDNPEFPRVIELARLRDQPDFSFDISPRPDEAEALARLLDAQTLRKLRFKGKLTALAKGGWQLDAELGATVVQTCVVSLDPVTTRVDQSVRRAYLPRAAAARVAEVILSADDEDDVEPLGDRLDLGLIAIEALALALPPYPRKPDAVLAAGVAGDTDTPEIKPFAGLAALRDKLSEGS